MSQSMAKLESGSGSDGINKASQNNVMFVDTSLDTHLALLVSDSDTVSDLKKKILYEHPLCFPSIGKIQIHALKVKRKGNFYHLSDSMFVKSAFDGVKTSWFLCVDASCSVEHGKNQNSCIPASNNMLACFGIKNSTSFDRVDLHHDGPLQRASNVNDSSLPLVGSNQNAKENVPIGDKHDSSDSGKEVLKVKDAPIHGFGKDVSQQDIIVPENSLINAGREVSFDLRMGNKDIADELCRSSSSNSSKRSVSEIKRTNNLSKETEVTEKHDNCILDKFKNDVDVQCNNSLEETSKSRSYAKRKRNIEKESGDRDSLKERRALTCNSNKEISKAESASQHSAGDKQKTNAILDSISAEPVEDAHLLETVSSSGKSKKRRKKSSNPLIQLASAVSASGKDVVEENSRVTVGINHKDSSGERTTASVPRQDVQGATASELHELSVEEEQSDPVHEVWGNDKLTSSLVHKQKTNPTLDSSASEAFKNVLLVTDSSNGKKKRKKKSSNPFNRAVTSVPSFEKDVEEESSRVTGGINWKDSSKEPHAASVPGKGVQGVMTPELCGIYQKQNQCDSFHEAGENDKVSSSLDLDMYETEVGNVKSKNNASIEEAAVGVERMRNSKDSHFADLKGHQAVGVKDLSNLENNIELSRPENGVLNSTGLVEHRKSGKKERKKRKPEDLIGGTPIKSGIELVKSSEYDISSAEPHKTVNCDHSSNKAKKEENTFAQTKGNDDDNFETNQTDRVEEERESLHNRDPKGVLSEKFKSPIQIETDMNAKEVIATSKSLDGTELVEHRKSAKKERKKRKPEDSVGGTPIKSGIELVKSSKHDTSSAEPHKTVNGDHSISKDKKEEHTFSLKMGKEISKTKTVSTSLLATVGETGDVNGDEMESLQQISKTQANAENMDEKMRKKSKKKQNSTAKNLLDLQRKDQDVGHKDSTDNQREVEASSKMTNENQGSGEKSQVGNYSTIQLQGDECDEHMLHSEKKLVKVSRIEDLVEGTPIKSGIEHGKSSEHEIFSAEPLKTANSDHSSEISKKDESNFSQTKGKSKTKTVSTSLLATGREAGDVYGDEVQSLQKISKTRANAENMDEKTRKKSKKKQNSTAKNLLDLQTKAQDVGHKDPTPSADNQREVEASSKMTKDKQGSGGKSQAGNSSTIQLQGPLSKDEGAEHMLHPEKKLLKGSRSGMKAPQSTKSDKFISIPEDVRRPNVVNDSETSINSERKSEAFAVSKSNLGNSVHQSKLGNEIRSGVGQGVRNASVNDIGEVVNNSEQDKSLLAKSGAIFKDDSSGSSEDEDGMVNSDASTRTPSDNSFSSDYSDGESNANLNSPRKGSYDSKRKKGGRRSITKAFSSGEKSMTLDTILRSSSRYKKAKLTATQSQLEDNENQPVDFVPDSQADL